MRSLKIKIPSGVIGVVSLTLTMGVGGAGTTGEIVGNITGAYAGEPVPYACVLLFQSGVKTNIEACADSAGNYRIDSVPEGSYTAEFSMMGYYSTKVIDIRVAADSTTILNVKLGCEAPDDIPPTISVTQPIPIERDPLECITITGEEIERMPADDIEQVIERLVPGAINTSP
jgi:hypothetical protein